MKSLLVFILVPVAQNWGCKVVLTLVWHLDSKQFFVLINNTLIVVVDHVCMHLHKALLFYSDWSALVHLGDTEHSFGKFLLWWLNSSSNFCHKFINFSAMCEGFVFFFLVSLLTLLEVIWFRSIQAIVLAHVCAKPNYTLPMQLLFIAMCPCICHWLVYTRWSFFGDIQQYRIICC